MAASVYTFGLVAADIAARIGGATINAVSKPTETQVTEWIEEACGMVQTELERLGVDATTITSSAYAPQYKSIRHHVAQYVAGLWHDSDQRDAGEFGTRQQERWEALTDGIERVASRWLGDAAPTQMKSSVTASSLATTPAKLRGSGNWFD